MIKFKNKTIIVSFLVATALISTLTPILYYTNYVIRGENAIIFLIGDPQMEFDDLRYTVNNCVCKSYPILPEGL